MLTMMKSALAFVTLSAAAASGAAAAFAPSSSQTAAFVTKYAQSSHHVLQAEKNDEQNAVMNLDDNFDDVNLVGLMGLKRLKKVARRHKRELNERVRSFEVVQNAEGEWIEATAAQTAEMKAAAGVGTAAAPTTSSTALSASASSSDGGDRDEPLRLIIAGAPASGKGTQCEGIKEKYGVVHLSTGDMLRAAVADGTDVGKAARDYMDAGKLVPDEVIIGVVKDRLAQSDCASQGWLLDGFPRTPAQADALASAGISADCFIFLNVPDSALIERVCGRRTDPVTGKIYHLTFSPPDDEEVAARLEHRSDDTEEKVKVRLEAFHANVDAVKGSYADVGVEIDGSQKPEEVAQAIASAVAAKIGA